METAEQDFCLKAGPPSSLALSAPGAFEVSDDGRPVLSGTSGDLVPEFKLQATDAYGIKTSAG